MADLADHSAATTAGYTRTQLDRGAGTTDRFTSRYERPLRGASNTASGGKISAEGKSEVSQAAADTAALNALNAQRRHRYGAGAAAGTDGRGGTLTFDAS